MPKRKRTEEEEYKCSMKETERILSKYSSIEKLRKKRQKAKNNKKYREAYNDYKTYQKYQRKVESYEKKNNIYPNNNLLYCIECSNESSDNSSDTNERNDDEDEETECVDEFFQGNQSCGNCKRTQYYHNASSVFHLSFSVYQTHQIYQRKFKFCTKANTERTSKNILLCEQCSNYLINVDNKEAQKNKNSWPGFMWYVLTNDEVKEKYKNYAWRFIPKEWRYWWIDKLKELHGETYSNITIDNPPPIFVEKTEELGDWTQNINSCTYSGLRDTINKHMFPKVLCPFGCTEYIQEGQQLPIDTIVQRYLRRLYLKKRITKRDKQFNSARDDYLTIGAMNYEWVSKEEWKAMPTIILDSKKGAVVVGCRRHGRGCRDFYIHTPKQPKNILPAKYSDQLCHCVIQSRTVRPLKRSGFSDSYQMHEQRGTFSGLDTCSITNFGNFDRTSILLDESEARSIAGRPDISALLNNLVDDKLFPLSFAESKRKQSRKKMENVKLDEFVSGSTYVPVEAAMSLQRETLNEECNVIILNPETNEERTRQFKKVWPEYIYPCQRMDDYGATFVSVPAFQMKKVEHISVHHVMNTWQICEILSSTQSLWSDLCKKELRKNEWHGWLLVYITRKCFPTLKKMRQDENDPFKKQYVSKTLRVVEKIMPETLQSAFINIPNTTCSQSTESLRNCNSNTLIISNYSVQNNHMPPMETDTHELTSIICCWSLSDTGRKMYRWDGYKYSRHGNKHKKWWFRSKSQDLPIHSDLPESLEEDKVYTLVYKKKISVDFEKAKIDFLKYLGGASHLRCRKHKCPLIASYTRDKKCMCGKKEFYRCCDLYCTCRICSDCAKNKDKNVITYVDEIKGNETISETRIDTEENGDDEENNERNQNITIENNTGDNQIDIEQYEEPLTYTDDPYIDEYIEDYQNLGDTFPTTDAGEVAVETTNLNPGKHKDLQYVSGHVLMNQCGSLLSSRKNHVIKGSSKHQYFIHRLCATVSGKSIPILYPEAMLFPSIFYVEADEGAIAGAIPAPLLTETITKMGFASIKDHLKTRLTSCSSSTSTNPRYIAWAYDHVVNIMANHCDTRIILNRGLTVDDNSMSGLTIRGKDDNKLLESFESKQWVRNLCAGMAYHHDDYFATLTCNQKQHFGTSELRRWIDQKGWKNTYPNYHKLSNFEQEEIDEAYHQAASSLMLRNWLETCKHFIKFLQTSPNSPYKRVLSIFARHEYQKEIGNLSHIHMLIELDWKRMTTKEAAFVKDLIRTSILDIIKPGDELKQALADGTFKNISEYREMQEDGERTLPHKCSQRCQFKVGPDKTKCKKWNNNKISPNPARDYYYPLPNELSRECNERLIKCGMAHRQSIGNGRTKIVYHDKFYYPTRHVPKTNTSDDMNISPVEGQTFSNTRSMNNIQELTHAGGAEKYVCKYMTKIDEGNRVIPQAGANGDIKMKEQFLYNTKITTSKINEDKALKQSRDKHKPMGRSVSQNEMLHQIFGHPDIYTNRHFVQVPTMQLEKRPGIEIKRKKEEKNNDYPSDGKNLQIDTYAIRKQKRFPSWREHTDTEYMVLDDVRNSNISVDKITIFSVRPPELRRVFNAVGEYFRWFAYDKKRVTWDDMKLQLKDDVTFTSFIDGLQNKIKVRRQALPEIEKYLNTIELDDTYDNEQDESVINIFKRIIRIDKKKNNGNKISNKSDRIFMRHVEKNIMIDEKGLLLPIPVYTYIIPAAGPRFILHILLSMGRFDNEVNLLQHKSLRDCLRYAGLIGPSNDPDDLERYSNKLLYRYLKKQLFQMPKSKQILSGYTCTAGEVFDSIIINDEIPIHEMPPVQLSTIYASQEQEVTNYMSEIRKNVLDAALKEVGEDVIKACNIPSRVQLLNADKSYPLEWDPITNFKRINNQPEQSFKEQKEALTYIKQTIDKYTTVQNSYSKNFIIRGFPGSGKSWTMMYALIYARSLGLNVISTAQMAKRAIQLGGTHFHNLFCMHGDKGKTIYSASDNALINITKDAKKGNLLNCLDVLFVDEIGQVTAELMDTIDIIMRRKRESSIFQGGLLIIATMDHTQILPFQKRPFLTSSHLISSFEMYELTQSVRTHHKEFQELQSIVRQSYSTLINNKPLVDRFIYLASKLFTFVDSWDSDEITPSTYRLYGKKIPAKEASREFVRATRAYYKNHNIKLTEKRSIDLQKHRFSHREWKEASDETKQQLEQEVREPETLLFFKGAVYEFTYNQPGQFSYSQMALLLDVPTEEELKNFKKIKVLAAPPGLKEILYNKEKSKDEYILEGYVEVKVGVPVTRTKYLSNHIQATRKQYGLRHRVTGTIHSIMGDTLERLACQISILKKLFKLWDKAQLVVLVSRTRDPANIIFVGNKSETLRALKEILLLRSQWTEHIERILNIITINKKEETNTTERSIQSRVLTMEDFPYTIRNVSLPNCRSGFVYMLYSKKKKYIYIGQTIDIIQRIKSHNRGYGAKDTKDFDLRPFAVIGLITGFEGDTPSSLALRLHVELQWKLKRDSLIQKGEKDIESFLFSGQEVIDDLVYTNRNIDKRLVLQSFLRKKDLCDS